MSDCREKPRSFLKVHFFLTSTEENPQRMQAICNLITERQGCGGRIRKPFGNTRVCRRVRKRVTGFPPKRVLEFTIDLKPRTKPIARTPYRMLTLSYRS
jgi:hypothetical protein